MALLSAFAIWIAIIIGAPIWSVLIGVGAAQGVMVAASIRRGVSA